MSGFREPTTSRESYVLFPSLLDEIIPADHRARLFLEILSSKSFQATLTKMEADYDLLHGQPPYRPKYLVALYLYGMMDGIRSSRKLEAACKNRIDVIWLMENQAPDHSTITGFVKRHTEILHELFRNTLELGRESGLVKLSHVAVDGTKLEANASKSSVKPVDSIQERFKALDAEIEKLEAEWKENEVREHSIFADDEEPSEPQPPANDRKLERMKEKRDRLKAALEAFDRRQAQTTKGNKSNPVACTTDPDARHMKDKKGNFCPGFNVQMAVDATAGMIVALGVNDRADDSGLLLPMVNQVTENVGVAPAEVSADKAYNVGHDLLELEKAGVQTYVPAIDRGSAKTPEAHAAVELAREGKELTEADFAALPSGAKQKISRDAFTYDAASDTYRCPTGQIMTPGKVFRDPQLTGVSLRVEYRVAKGACVGCPFAERCCENPQEGRMVTRDQYETARENTRNRMNSEEGKAKYKQRSHTAETPNAAIKTGWGYLRVLRRGFQAVRAEVSMMCTSYNLRIMIAKKFSGAPLLDSG